MILYAAEFGSDLHFHDDVTCIAALPEDEYDGIPLSKSAKQVFNAAPQSILQSASQYFFSLVGIRPPPNGPPLATY